MNFAEWFEYRDGKLYWAKKPAKNIAAGAEAGHRIVERSGYKTVRLLGKAYKLHRIVWVLHHGEIPEGMQIDHINGDAADSRIENLRLATASQNQENRRCRGTYFCNTHKKWFAKIQVRKTTRRTIGAFATEAEAHAAYLAAKRELHEFCTI